MLLKHVCSILDQMCYHTAPNSFTVCQTNSHQGKDCYVHVYALPLFLHDVSWKEVSVINNLHLNTQSLVIPPMEQNDTAMVTDHVNAFD